MDLTVRQTPAKRNGCIQGIVWLVSFGITIVFGCAQVLAQTPQIKKDTTRTDSAKTHQLKQVEIRATKSYPRNISPTPVQILKGDQLQRLNSLSVADAVRYFSGVQIKDYGGIGGLKTINVRSLGSNHIAVFYDGVELGNAQNGQVDLGKFSLDNIDEIELYNGQKNTIFQPAKGFASASSLYLTAKQPVFAAGKTDNEKASIKTGSFGLFNPSVLWQHKFSRNVAGSFNAEWVNANGRYRFRTVDRKPDTSATRHNGDIDARRIEAGLTGKMRDSSSWSAKAYFYNSERGLPGAVISNRFDYPQRQWDRNIFVQGGLHENISKNYSLLLNVKYANDFTRYLDPELVKDSGLLDNHYYQQEIYLSAANRYHINQWWDVALSADYQWNKLNADLDHFAYPIRNTFLVALATELHFSRFTLAANALGTFVNDKVKYFDSAGSKSELSPTAMLSWQPFDPNLSFRAFYKNIFRMPTFNDLYYTFVGNTFLKPEFAKQFDAGFTYAKTITGHTLAAFSIQADAYYNQVTDKIVAVPSANLFRWTMINLGKVHIKGLEVNAHALWHVQDVIFNTGVSYTYQQALDVTGNYNYRAQIPYAPLNSGSFLAGADWHKWAFNYSYIYTGSRYRLGTNTPDNYVQPWYTHDIAFHYNTPVGHHRLKITAEVNNLFNQYYELIVNFPLPGRSYRFTLNFTY
jgi:vitamin B12 transporter